MSADEANGDKKSIWQAVKPMAVGGGVFGCRIIDALTTGDDDDNAGVYIGLCSSVPSTYIGTDGSFDIEGMKYGVQVNGAGALQGEDSANLQIIMDGEAIDTESLDPPFDNPSPLFSTKSQQEDLGITTPKYVDLPYIEFGWDMGRLELRTYQQDPDATPTLQRKIIYQFDIDNDGEGNKDFLEVMGQTKLYPVIIFASKATTDGEFGGTLVGEIYFTASPHLNIGPIPPKHGYGATRIMGNPALQATAWLKLSQPVQRYFSFPSAYLPSSAPTKGDEYTNEITFTGGQVSTTTGFPENFVVELLTLPLDSYDGQELLADGTIKGAGQRKSILATIPQDRNANGVLRHETGDPYYIDLNNLEPILLRNMFVRLLDNDLEQVPMNGQGCITLLTREKGKQ